MAKERAAGAWVITGAASGFGRTFAERLARRGERVALWDRDTAGLEETMRRLGQARTCACKVDVSDPESVRSAVAASRDALGTLAHVVNCAGILRVGPATQMSPADYRLMMDVNVLGSVHVACALVPELQRAASAGGRATLLLVASVAGLRGFPELAGYSASKHAVVGFGRALRDELAGQGVDVRVLCPPTGDTPMVHNLPYRPKIYDLSPALSAETIVDAALAGLERPGFLVLVDARTKLLWKLGQLAPGVIDGMVRRATRA